MQIIHSIIGRGDKNIKKNNLKILLIAVKEKLTNLGCENPSLGLISVASYLVENNLVDKDNLKIVDTFFDDPIDILDKFKPDLIGISVITPFYLLARKYATEINSRFHGIKIIIGGAHVSSEYSILDKEFFAGVIGEGEETFADLVNLLNRNINPRETELKRINGIIFRNKKGVLIKTPKRSLIEPLDKIAKTDWSLISENRVVGEQVIRDDSGFHVYKSASLYTSRGCPYQCTFCAYNNVWGRGQVRFFSSKYIGEMMESLYNDYGVKAFCILDDTFAITKDRIREIILELKRRKLLGKIFFFKIFIRANLIDEEMCALLKELGVVSVFMGIESGSQRILNFLKKSSLNLFQVKNALKLFGDRGIFVMGSFMFFSPNETKADINMTLDFMRWFSGQKNVIDVNICITTPFPGTELWRMEDTKEYIKNRERYLSLVSLTDNCQKEEIFYFNDLKKEDCLKLWHEAVEISQGLQRRLYKNDLLRKNTFKTWIKIAAMKLLG